MIQSTLSIEIPSSGAMPLAGFGVQPSARGQRISKKNICRTALVMGSAEQRAGVAAILVNAGWNVREEKCILDALLSVLESPVAVVLTGCDLPDGSWREVVNFVQPKAAPPKVIVMSPLADERLWAEVLNLGGFDLLPDPLDVVPLVRTVESAYQDWMSGAVAA